MTTLRTRALYYADLVRRLGARRTLARVVRRVRKETERTWRRVKAPTPLSDAAIARVLPSGSIRDLPGVLGGPLWALEREDVAELREALDRAEPDHLRATLVRAERTARGEARLLGRTWRVDPSDDDVWRRDPGGPTWPRVYYREIDIGAPDRPGDIKLPWEIGRHQYLVPAAKAYFLTRDEAWARLVRDHLLSFIRENPREIGIHWWSALEIGVRVVTWTLLVALLRGSEALAVGLAAPLARSLVEQVLFLECHLADDSEGPLNNHAIGEAAGLALGGILLDVVPAERWRRRGLDILSRELERQVGPDGVDYEGTTSYQRFVLELCLAVALGARLRGFPLPSAVRAGTVRLAEGLAAIAAPSGRSPRLGDADDGRGIDLGEARDHWDHQGAVAVVGALEDRADLRAVGGPADEWMTWLLGASAAAAPARGPDRSVGLEAGGWYVMRSDGGPDASWVFVDASPLGQGRGGPGGHGHCDIGSFEAAFGPVDLVVDPGTGTYLGGDARRNAFRSTASHNLVEVDGIEMADFGLGLFTIRDQARPSVESWRASPEVDRLVVSHDGYERLSPGVGLRRTFALGKPDALVVVDDLDSSAPHAYVLRLHLHPDLTIVATGGDQLVLERAGRRVARLVAADAAHFALEAYDFSPRYGVYVPATRAVRSVRAARARFVTWLVREGPPESVARSIAAAARAAGVAPLGAP